GTAFVTASGAWSGTQCPTPGSGTNRYSPRTWRAHSLAAVDPTALSSSPHTYVVGTTTAPTSCGSAKSVARYQFSAPVRAPGSSMGATYRSTPASSSPLPVNIRRSLI